MFNFSGALAYAQKTIDARNANRAKPTAYTLYYSNSNDKYDGKITGTTVKQLINEFRATYGTFKYAFITKINEDKVLRFYNRDMSKKFFSLTRKGGKKVK